MICGVRPNLRTRGVHKLGFMPPLRTRRVSADEVAPQDGFQPYAYWEALGRAPCQQEGDGDDSRTAAAGDASKAERCSVRCARGMHRGLLRLRAELYGLCRRVPR